MTGIPSRHRYMNAIPSVKTYLRRNLPSVHISMDVVEASLASFPHLGHTSRFSKVLHSNPQNPQHRSSWTFLDLQEGHLGVPDSFLEMKNLPQDAQVCMDGGSFHLSDLHDGHIRTSSEVFPPRVVHLCPHLLHWSLYAGTSHFSDLQEGQRSGWSVRFLHTLPHL